MNLSNYVLSLAIILLLPNGASAWSFKNLNPIRMSATSCEYSAVWVPIDGLSCGPNGCICQGFHECFGRKLLPDATSELAAAAIVVMGQ
jgi:hypothetical protein